MIDLQALKASIYPEQKRQDDQTVHPFIYLVFRPISWKPTLVLHRWGVTPMACTFWSGVILILGLLALGSAWPSPWWAWVLGGVLINVYLFLDVIDGNLARLSGRSTKAGEFADCSLNAVSGALLPIAIGTGLYFSGGDVASQTWGVPPMWLLVAGFSIACLRLTRRVLTDHASQLVGNAGDRANVLGEQRRGPKYWAAAVNSAAFPSVLPIAILAVPSLWLAFYLVFNAAVVGYSVVWAYRRVSAVDG
ncbi:CDP-alcohol phosphatidyltransferase family protein [Aquisalimonas sp.]|uniref:CDP-alcohol phosphatidyltransferase family protein n=1 Tax=Aquisalimonas sp. TaxID=1872621 RepID=UPI0025BE30B1|nr:CDP-alcohol phosphatidyltransferase family protein [Aquisalimonas sp.]